jgi:hypothetical protein
MLDDYPNEHRIQKHGDHYRGMVLHGVHRDVVHHDVVHHDVVHLPLNVALQSLSDLHVEIVRSHGVPLGLLLYCREIDHGHTLRARTMTCMGACNHNHVEHLRNH